VTLPLGMQLVHGTRVIVDATPDAEPYVICLACCMSDYDVTRNCSPTLKKGQNLVVRRSTPRAPLTLPLPLAEFARPLTARRPTRSVRGNPEEAARVAEVAPRKPARSSSQSPAGSGCGQSAAK